jgi:hypothetical protein
MRFWLHIASMLSIFRVYARNLRGDGSSVDIKMRSSVRIWTEVSTRGLLLTAQTLSQGRPDSFHLRRTRIFAASPPTDAQRIHPRQRVVAMAKTFLAPPPNIESAKPIARQINVDNQSIPFGCVRSRASRQQKCRTQPEVYQWTGRNMESRSYIRMNLI